MTKRGRYILLFVGLVPLAAYALTQLPAGAKVTIDQARPVGRPPRIRPDYQGAVIPPNIAPLNFLVQEDGSLYYVKL